MYCEGKNVLRGENIHYLSENVFKKLKSFLLPYAEIRMLIRLAGTGKLRIGSQHLLRVRGHLYLRHNRNIAVGGIPHQLPQLLLGIIPAVCSGSTLGKVFPLSEPPVLPQVALPPCSQRGQQGIAVNLHPPAGGIGQMQMQAVEFQGRHRVYLFLEKIHVEEMPRHILHIASPGKPGTVRYADAGYTVSVRLDKLPQSLPCVKKTGTVPGGNQNRIPAHFQGIGFRSGTGERTAYPV